MASQRWFLMVFAALVAVVLLASVPTLVRLTQYPTHTAATLRNSAFVSGAKLTGEARLALEKDLLLYETGSRIKIWTAIVQAIGGAALFIGLLFSWRNLRATQIKLDIARDSSRDYWPVMEILTACVRHNAVWHQVVQDDSKPAHADVQAILTVLGRSIPPEVKALRFDQKV